MQTNLLTVREPDAQPRPCFDWAVCDFCNSMFIPTVFSDVCSVLCAQAVRRDDPSNTRLCDMCGVPFPRFATRSVCSPMCRRAKQKGVITLWRQSLDPWSVKKPQCLRCGTSLPRGQTLCGVECENVWEKWIKRVTSCLKCGTGTGTPHVLLCDDCVQTGHKVGEYLCALYPDRDMFFPIGRAGSLPAVNLCLACDTINDCPFFAIVAEDTQTWSVPGTVPDTARSPGYRCGVYGWLWAGTSALGRNP